MRVITEIEIAKPKMVVWAAITDIKNCANMISAIVDLKIIDQADKGLVGLKWQETRVMFGKEATETMWITEAAENEYYRTRAESHGAIYKTKLSLSEKDNNTVLTMIFTGEGQTWLAKIMSACMGFFVKKSMQKMLQKDLEDIKKYLEQP